MKDKLKFIIFEGVDKAGKTTIHKLFDKKTEYKYLTCDRLFLTYLAYCKRYNRPINHDIFNWVNDRRVVIVYLMADESELNKRYFESGHEKIDVKKDKKSFMLSIDIFKSHKVKILKIDTADKTPEETVNEIIKLIGDDKK